MGRQFMSKKDKHKKEDRTEHFRKLSKEIDDLYYSGQKEAGEKLLLQAREEAKGDEGYRLFFDGEVAGYVEEDLAKQTRLFKEAVEARPNDFFLMRNLGVSLSLQGKEDEAISWYNKALAVNPQDFNSLRNIGVSLSKQGKYDDAISSFNKALAVNPKDFNSYRETSVVDFNRGKHEASFTALKEAYRLAPEHEKEKILNDFRFINVRLKKDLNAELGLKGTSTKSDAQEIRGLVSLVREKFKPSIEEFLKKKAEFKANLMNFLNPESRMIPDRSIFLPLRKWNSYTPAIPQTEERSLGGGYFILHNGKGTVIDPGYNFIENFEHAGGRIVDIDTIVITHAHNDHTNDLESLMTLFHQYNKENKFKSNDSLYKRIDLYMNLGGMMKFAGLLDLRGCEYLREVRPLSPDNKYELAGGIRLTVLRAYHDEIISKKHAVGLHLSLDTPKGTRTLLFTSDTGLYPQMKNKNGETVADFEGAEIQTLYADALKDKLTLLVAHIGSIEKKEIMGDINTKPEEVYYPNHLGVIGTARIITDIKPKIALVSEFGEELKDFRPDLMKLLREVVEESLKEKTTKVLPSDLAFIFDLKDETAYCVISEGMVPIDRIEVENCEGDFYYYDKAKSLKDFKAHIDMFETRRRVKFLPYIKE